MWVVAGMHACCTSCIHVLCMYSCVANVIPCAWVVVYLYCTLQSTDHIHMHVHVYLSMFYSVGACLLVQL